MKAPEGFTLRPATRDDSAAVKCLVFSILAEYGLASDPGATDSDLEDLEQFYFTSGGRFDVLVETNTRNIIGSVGLLPLGDGRCELRKMYLAPEFRHRGLGKFLLQHALAEARRLGFERVLLETATGLKEALRLYRSFGFQPGSKEHVASRCDTVLELQLF